MRDVANARTMNSLILPWPPLAEQQAISEMAKYTSRRFDAEAAGLAKLRLLKQGLMEDLLTGRVRVTPLLAESTP